MAWLPKFSTCNAKATGSCTNGCGNHAERWITWLIIRIARSILEVGPSALASHWLCWYYFQQKMKVISWHALGSFQILENPVVSFLAFIKNNAVHQSDASMPPKMNAIFFCKALGRYMGIGVLVLWPLKCWWERQTIFSPNKCQWNLFPLKQCCCCFCSIALVILLGTKLM